MSCGSKGCGEEQNPGGWGVAKQCQVVCVRGLQSRKPGECELGSRVATSGAGQPGPSL